MRFVGSPLHHNYYKAHLPRFKLGAIGRVIPHWVIELLTFRFYIRKPSNPANAKTADRCEISIKKIALAIVQHTLLSLEDYQYLATPNYSNTNPS